MPSELVEDFYGRLPTLTADPLTGYLPKSEIELSAALVRQNGRGRIRWSKVRFHASAVPGDEVQSSEAQVDVGSRYLRGILCAESETFAEYPMSFSGSAEVNRWGGMRADALILTDKSVVLIEAKVDSHFTYGDKAPDGQLSRQIEFLKRTGRMAALLLICPEFNLEWYKKRLFDAFENSKAKVAVGLATWEDVFACAG